MLEENTIVIKKKSTPGLSNKEIQSKLSTLIVQQSIGVLKLVLEKMQCSFTNL